MTRKDYVAIAAVLAKHRKSVIANTNDIDAIIACNLVALDLGDLFAADNAMFNRARFLKAAGVQS